MFFEKYPHNRLEWQTSTCDIGHLPAEVRQQFPPEHFPDIWRYDYEETSPSAELCLARLEKKAGREFSEPLDLAFSPIADFLTMVHARPEECIALVGRSDWITHALAHHFGLEDV